MMANQLPVLPTFGSMVSRYVLQLYLMKNHIIAKNSTITKAREKYAQIWNP
jgi:hypothetical protein